MVEIHKNLCLRSDEPGKVLNLLGNLLDGEVNETSTQEYIKILLMAVEHTVSLLVSIGQGTQIIKIFEGMKGDRN